MLQFAFIVQDKALAVMKQLFDFFPVIIFFLTYKLFGFYVATTVAIIASIVQVAVLWLKKGRVENMYLISCILIVVLGSVSLILHNQLFFQWKPTAINWAFAVVFLSSQIFSKKPIIQRMMEKNITLPQVVWSRLNLIWVVFFTLMGSANLYVVYHYDMDTWVNFKVFGVLGLTIVFVIAQAIYLTRHIGTANEKDENLVE